MAEAVDQAQRQRELSKQALVADLDRFEAKVRSELDVRSRLRRDGVRILAVGGAAVVLVVGLVVLRARLRHDDEPAVEATSLEEVRAELREIRRTLEKQSKGQSMVQKVALRAVGAAGAAAGNLVARRMLARQPSEVQAGKVRESAR